MTAANDVIDLDEIRTASLENYVPAAIMLLLLGIATVTLAFIGWSFGAAERRSLISTTVLAVLVTIVLAVIMDINRPLRGIIRVGDESLVRLRQTLASP